MTVDDPRFAAVSNLPPDLLRDRTVFISGGGSGINLAIAEQCAVLGANLSICGRTEAKLDAAATRLSSLGAKVCTSVADVRDLAAVQDAFRASAEQFGPVDAVVCGAAGNFMAPAERLTSNGFRAVVDIDLLGSFHCASAAYEQLARTNGALLFISGGQSLDPMVYQAHVAAAKAGVDQLMRSLALEWGAKGIRANSIVPGPVADTEGMRRLAETSGLQPWLDMIPLGRFAQSCEIGLIAALMISPLTAYMNGAQVVVDGGMSLSGTGALTRSLRSVAETIPQD